ncbi:baseplate J/gp47 family protein [Lentilactobacillus sp. SPB1-3]|uniref:Baseplate J/gp47 family protein n=1 Tax=Lentilactobacillus terminaliae TaxID=3003483 RepID=A0ACD5DDJ0_9LACO|nr:baseplate J/gp47 family protein [Lentilactobacillus sp. SPB1-3]MCZ0978123.1 baseplate J/gp47 family protein [Lentilactobacillus sp. SPB1-3]
MPLTSDDGYFVPDEADVRASIVKVAQGNMGTDIDTSAGSPLGQMITAWASMLYDVELHAQDVYDSAFTDLATGISLDRKGSNVGIQRNLAQPAQVNMHIIGQSGYLVDEGTEFLTDNGDSFKTSEDVQIGDDGTVDVIAYSDDAASYTNVDANTIVNQSNPVDEITSINNPEAAYGGVDLETDFDFRQRIKANNKSRPGPTDEGLQTAILNVPGVTGVSLQDNRTNQVDQYGNPAFSMHFFVSGGNPQEVGQAIADNLAGGAMTVGSQEYHYDILGSDVEIHFDSAETVPIKFKITLTASGGYNEDAIKQAVGDFLDDFDMGKTIILNRLYQYIYDLIGVEEITDIEASTDGVNYSTSNIQLKQNQLGSTSDDAIEVIVNE